MATFEEPPSPLDPWRRGGRRAGPGRHASRPLALCAIAAALSCSSSSSSSPTAPDQTCGPYPAQASSPYVLPYPPGQEYVVRQENCTPGTHALGTRDGFAYDFGMPIGSAGLTIPVTFQNTSDHPNGLEQGQTYLAL